MVSRTAIAAFILAGAAFIPAIARYGRSLRASEFAEKAALGNEFEILSSRIAAGSASSAAVRALAKQMLVEHGRIGRELRKALKDSNAAGMLPDGDMGAQRGRTLGRLRRLTGRKFDALYLDAQKKAHDDAVSLFRSYTEEGDDPVLRSFAARTLPVLELHQEKVGSFKATRH